MLTGVQNVASRAYQLHCLFSAQKGGKKRQQIVRKYERRSGVGQMGGTASAVSLKTREVLRNGLHKHFVSPLKLGG
jgi:hypothetical protein